jgi:hypothetical protein
VRRRLSNDGEWIFTLAIDASDLGDTADGREGLASFKEERDPRFGP